LINNLKLIAQKSCFAVAISQTVRPFLGAVKVRIWGMPMAAVEGAIGTRDHSIQKNNNPVFGQRDKMTTARHLPGSCRKQL
jgi:hypothetical protein